MCKMWGQKGGRSNSDNLLKESLLCQLSHSVKEVQLHHSQTKETCTIQEGTSSLVSVLEAIFLHSLKRSLFESAFRSVTVSDDARPSPSFYDVIQPISHRDTLARIANLPQIKNDVGRCRAWLRLALNDAAVPSYLAGISTDKRLTRYYRPTAFLRDKETLDTASRLLDGLLPIPFDIPLNSSLLNAWNSEPLLISGIWSPALRATVQVAVDVAGNIDDEESCSEITASPSMRSLLTLDESQALQLILDTHGPIEEKEVGDEVNEVVEEGGEEAGFPKQMERSYSYLLNNCDGDDEGQVVVEQSEIVKKDVIPVFDEESEEPAFIPPQTEELSKPVTKRKPIEGEFRILMANTEEGDLQRKKIEEMWTSIPVTTGIEEQPKRNRNLEEIIIKIPRELGLQAQRYQCPDCNLSIGIMQAPAIYCHLTGEYLCESCHCSALGVVPARIIYNWDYNKYCIGERANNYISSKLSEPMFDMEKLNPKLYNIAPEMKEILQLRRQLKFISYYLISCKESSELEIRKYIYETVHVYSLSDILAIPGGQLRAELAKIVAQARGHIVQCWLCSQKGFVCEICRDPKVIYPFDEGSIYRCSKCQAVYHGGCLSSSRSCRKCKRIKKRLNSRGDEM